MATYPTTLPAPQKSISITLGDTCVRRDTLSGRQEIRRMGSGAPDIARLSLRLTWDEWVVFKEFYTRDLNLGLNWFSADWLTTLGYTAHKARLTEFPRERARQKQYVDVSLSLVIQLTTDITTTDSSWPS